MTLLLLVLASGWSLVGLTPPAILDLDESELRLVMFTAAIVVDA